MKTIILFLLGILSLTGSIAQKRLSSYVTFKSGNETIEGIFVRPDIGGKLPVVVFQQGSGNHSFDGYDTTAWGPHKFYIEDVLLEQGYAMLYCNKRGLGNSTGNWKSNDFYGRADDAYAAVNYLKTRNDVDSSRIGISGHSQGGWIAQIVASQHADIAFVISLAGPTVGVRAQTEMNDSLYYICKGVPPTEMGKKMEKYRKRKKKAAGIGKMFPFIKSAYYWHLIYDYENNETLQNISCPTLLLFAEHDMNVPPGQNIDYLHDLFDDNPPDNFTVEIMKGGQHGFYIVDNFCVDWETAVSRNVFDPGFQSIIRDWVISLEVSSH